jgi:hypothetical protein
VRHLPGAQAREAGRPRLAAVGHAKPLGLHAEVQQRRRSQVLQRDRSEGSDHCPPWA